MARICCLSDLHGFLPEVPACDLLLLAGDYCPHTKEQNWWLRDVFEPWLASIAARGVQIVGIAGNHDLIWEKRPDLVPPLSWHYLQDSECNRGGLTIYGSPWQRRYYDWAFNLDEPELAEKWAHIPTNIDILVVHGPPYLVGDTTSRRERIGSPTLRSRIEVVKPLLVVCGHNHAGYGIHRLDDTIVVNASLVDENYRPVNQPIVIDLPCSEKP